MRITHSDILDFLTNTLVALEDYPNQVLNSLSKVFGLDLTAFWTACDNLELRSPIVRGIKDSMLSDYCEIYKGVCPLYPTNSFNQLMKYRVLTINDLRRSSDTQYYSDIYLGFSKKYAMVPLISIYLFDNFQTLIGAVAINRRPDERELQESEKEMFLLLGKHISNRMASNKLYVNNHNYTSESTPKTESFGSVIIDTRYNILYSNNLGINILQQIFPHANRNDLAKTAFGSLTPPVKLPILFQEERILSSPSTEIYRIVINPLVDQKKNPENLYSISIFPEFSNNHCIKNNTQFKYLYHLTEREYEIVCLLQQGYSNDLIAEKLSITQRTVKAHVHNIFDKIGVSTRGKLIYKIS